MLLSITFWLLVSLIAFWILLGPVTKVLRTLWEIIMQIYDKKPIDLKTKFGEWAGKYNKLFLRYLVKEYFISLKFKLH